MTHYAIAQLNEGRYGDTSILSPQGMAELHAPPISMNRGDDYYAMGWEVSKLDGIPVVGHGGLLPNSRSEILLLPEKGWGVILLANAKGFEQVMQVYDVAKGVVSMLNGEPAAPVSLIFMVSFLYWTILLMPLLQIIGIVYSWRRWRNKGVRHILLVVVLYGSIALLWLFGVPHLTLQEIGPGMRIFYPEFYYGLIAGVGLGIGWSVIFTAMNLRARKVK